ncbi:hypothetical protein [Daejeonella sp.]|uniref:hypothetical protein n=1 Tax=Daejeonella sp. TaxID=2805397 RepID=UPI0027B9328D|nr:hypothetical protein [Daejeonella sp.]
MKLNKCKNEDLHDLLNKYHTSINPNDSKTNDSLSIWEFMGKLTTDKDFRTRWGIANQFENSKDNSNLQQDSLLNIILGITLDSNIRNIQKSGKGQVWYLYANAVASYASYNPFYWVSESASDLLNFFDIDDSTLISRNKIFQIRTPERKKILLFEHLCPATHLIELILARTQEFRDNFSKLDKSEVNARVELEIKKLFLDYGIVAVITKEEDAKIKNTLRSRLDTSISNKPMDQMLARYKTADITLCEKLIPVFGKMYR